MSAIDSWYTLFFQVLKQGFAFVVARRDAVKEMTSYLRKVKINLIKSV